MDQKKISEEKIFSADISLNENFTKFLPKTIPFEKPLSIAPPATLREAMLSPWWPFYKKAIQAEYDGLLESKTFEKMLLKDVPKGKNILRGKWILDDKRGEDGTILKYKARFVAMGNTQKYGIDYEETFAGVMVSKSFRIMLSILNEDPENEMEHWDVKMAFTQAPLEDEIFMYEPEGFETEGTERNVCRLKKSLYGLKQSARNWQLLLKTYFHQNNISPTHADPCVFSVKKENGFCMCSTHVDDIFVLFNKAGKQFRDSLFESILAEIPIENLGPVSWALKTAILRDRKNGILKISQEQYCKDYLSKAGPRKYPSLKSPATNPNFPEASAPDDNLDRLDETLKKEFQSDIGAFWWLAQISRPDIYYAVHRCSKLVNKPNKRLGQRIQKIKDYLSLTPSVGIVFQKQENSPTLSGYVDAAFASEDGAQSRVGYFFLFKGNLVSWASENPSRVMTSSTEVECRGLVTVGKENLWHLQLQKELGLYKVQEPTTIYEDNTASIHLASDLSTPHKRSKHFGIEWSFFKESVEKGEIRPVYVSTDQQPADMLTKALISHKFIDFREMVMGNQDLQDHFDQIKCVSHWVQITQDLQVPVEYKSQGLPNSVKKKAQGKEKNPQANRN
jgi:hypothetical protein